MTIPAILFMIVDIILTIHFKSIKQIFYKNIKLFIIINHTYTFIDLLVLLLYNYCAILIFFIILITSCFYNYLVISYFSISTLFYCCIYLK